MKEVTKECKKNSEVKNECKKGRKREKKSESEREIEHHLLLPESGVAWTGSVRVHKRELHLRSGSKVHALHIAAVTTPKRPRKKKKSSRRKIFSRHCRH